jgi:hypothetical protein
VCGVDVRAALVASFGIDWLTPLKATAFRCSFALPSCVAEAVFCPEQRLTTEATALT